jgi:hypothetical protein
LTAPLANPKNPLPTVELAASPVTSPTKFVNELVICPMVS